MPAMNCAAVTGLDLSGVTDGTVTITSAVVRRWPRAVVS
jgi:feruloyl esterase